MNDPSDTRSTSTARVAQPSIRTVADLERDYARRQLSFSDRVADALGSLIGSFHFVILELLLVLAWVALNSGLVPGITPFDRPPFALLQLVVGIEAILLLTFVVRRENLVRRQADQRAQLELQVNLLAERKSTEILQLLLRISEELGLEELAQDEETQHLSKKTHLETLAQELENHQSDSSD